MTAPIVVGVDLSLTGTGIAFAAGTPHLITSSGTKGDTLASRWSRLRMMAARIGDLCQKADLVVIEAPAYSSRQGSMHDRSGLWWLVVDRLSEVTEVVEVTPSGRAKYAAGKGNASKDMVLAEVVRRFPDYTGSNNNTADAYVLMAMGLDHAGYPLVDLPQTHRTALDAVRWPA